MTSGKQIVGHADPDEEVDGAREGRSSVRLILLFRVSTNTLHTALSEIQALIFFQWASSKYAAAKDKLAARHNEEATVYASIG